MIHERSAFRVLDYAHAGYGGSRLRFRAPPPVPRGPHCVILGGTETYGKFVQHPYPAQLEARIGRPVINLGCLNAGPDAFLSDPALLSACRKATVRVVQIVGAHNLSNAFYTVHPRRNDRFLAAKPALCALYPDVDFAQFSFTRHLLGTLRHLCGHRFGYLVAALRATWTVRMMQLLGAIGQPALLFRISSACGSAAAPDDPLRHGLVTRDMVACIARTATGVVVGSVPPAIMAKGTEGMIHDPLDLPAAQLMPNPAAHAALAEALAPEVTHLMARRARIGRSM